MVDLNTGTTLFSASPGTPRLPASVEKLYTTSTALLRFGANATLTTRVFGVGSVDSTGAWHGTLYLKGGGDPTFGAAFFDRQAYGGAGATMQRLVTNLKRETGITSVHGPIVGDESYFDSVRGTPATGTPPRPSSRASLSGDRRTTAASRICRGPSSRPVRRSWPPSSLPSRSGPRASRSHPALLYSPESSRTPRNCSRWFTRRGWRR